MLDNPKCIDALTFTQKLVTGKATSPSGYGDAHRDFNAGKIAMVWGEQWNTSALI